MDIQPISWPLAFALAAIAFSMAAMVWAGAWCVVRIATTDSDNDRRITERQAALHAKISRGTRQTPPGGL